MHSTIRSAAASAVALFLCAGILSAATIRVDVRDAYNRPLPGVQVTVAGFPPGSTGNGDPDPRAVDMQVTSGSGTVTFSGSVVISSYSYQVLVTSAGYGPTIREQMDNPTYGKFFVRSDSDAIWIARILKPIVDVPLGTLAFRVTGIPGEVADNTMVYADVRNSGTGSPVAFGFGRVQQSSATITVYNAPEELTPGTYKAAIGVLQGSAANLGMEVSVSTVVVRNLTVTVGADFGSATSGSRVDDDNGSKGTLAFSGVVGSTASYPLEGAVVELIRHDPEKNSGDFSGSITAYRTLTDIGGNFFFYDVAAGTYAVNVNKPGYLGVWDQKWQGGAGKGYYFTGSSQTGYLFRSYQLQKGLGTIRGRVLAYDEQFSGAVPVANAYVSANGIFGKIWSYVPNDPYNNYYTTGTISGQGWGGSGNAVTNFNGEFTISGLGFGNFDLNINTSFGVDYTFTSGANRRVQISTDAVTSVYAIDGSTFTINVPSIDILVSTIAARAGKISGTISFKDYAGSADRVDGTNVRVGPLSVIADQQNYDTGSPSGVYSWDFEGSTTPVISYTLCVATCTNDVPSLSYWLDVRSARWAVLNNRDSMLDFSSGMEITNRNFTLVPAGAVTVVVRDEKGNIFRRHQETISGNSRNEIGGSIFVAGPTQRREEIGEQGITTIYGLVPGTYRVQVDTYKTLHDTVENTDAQVPADYVTQTVNDINVGVDKTAVVEVRLKQGVLASAGGSALAMPPLAQGSPGQYGAGGWKAGTVLTSQVLSDVFFGSMMKTIPDTLAIGMGYRSDTNQWETKRIPEGKYDFYLGYINFYNPGFDQHSSTNAHQNFTVITTLPGVSVKEDALAPDATSFLVFGTGSLGNCTVQGTVLGSKFFTADAVEQAMATGGRDFFRMMPTVMIYDQLGSWKGYAAAVPSIPQMMRIKDIVDDPLNVQDYTIIAASIAVAIAAQPLEYVCEKLPAGRYTFVFEQPNYPPVMKQVTLTSGQDNAVDVDLDEARVTGCAITGVVRSSEGVVLMGANVTVINKNANIAKSATTDEQGRFSVRGIPSGVYRVDVSRAGFAVAGQKVVVAGSPVSLDMSLEKADASISGTVFTQRMPAKVLPGAKIVAYDENRNEENPGAYLPTCRTISDNNGRYAISGMQSGHSYRIYCIADGKLLEWRSETLEAGDNTEIDFTLKPSRPRLKVNVKKLLENEDISYAFVIEVPNRLVNPVNPSAAAAPVCRYSPVSSAEDPYDEDLATELLVEPGPNNTYAVIFRTLADSEFYKMRIRAYDGVNDYFEDILFGPKIEARVKKDIGSELAEGGQVEIDSTGGDTTKIGLDAGALTPSNEVATTITSGGQEIPIGGFLSALPNFQMSRSQSARSVAMQKLVDSIVASDIYDIDLSSAQINKAITLTLNYDRSKIGENDLNTLVVGRYNSLTGQWEIIPGIVTVDPLTGTVSLDVESLGGTNAAPAPKAKYTGKSFVLNRAAAVSQSGMFAVFTQDPASVKAFSGSAFSVFNFPNPFDLKAKTVNLADVNSGSSQQVQGTMVKYALPAGTAGRLTFSIYNLAGEHVRELDLGDKDGGFYYYTEWDGKNDSGEDCASGAYFLIAKCDGKKLNIAPLKMAILK